MATKSARAMGSNPLRELSKYGQSIWLDYIRRGLITSGELQRLATEDGLRGVTSNPAIFEKAIDGSNDYDEAIRSLLSRAPNADARSLYEALAIEDVCLAAEVLRPTYDDSQGLDGYVSLEVSPHLARDTNGTIAEAQRLWKAVGRPNLMIKVPAAPEGIPAIESLIAAGINVNITLMFSINHYEAVAAAYLRGLEKCQTPGRISSVASFFVSRVDTTVDRALEELGTPQALSVRGKIAVANAKTVYQRFREIFGGEGFARFRQRGARVQRVLWASTGTKNPAYSDLLYVENLIGPDTVNTLPPATLNAFRDHGRPRASLQEGIEEAREDLKRAKDLGIDLDSVAGQLQNEGIDAFKTSYDQLLTGLEKKRRTVQVGQLDQQTISLGRYQGRVDQRLSDWQTSEFAGRLWRKDYRLWSAKPVPEISDRLGWLVLPEIMHEQLNGLKAFAETVKSEGFRKVVVLGMGGSSLAPEVFQRIFGSAPGYPDLTVLDSTHPDAVRAVEAGIDPSHTLFLVSSKSGTTSEPLSFFRYFWQRLGGVTRTPGDHFVAITDPGTPLLDLARERKFRRIFLAQPDVGGRYSALTVFGLVPAALIGVDLPRLLARSWTMSEACASCRHATDNPGLILGASLGELALAGRDKVTFLSSASLAALPLWIEQLIAESTGKNGKGIVPVTSEPPGAPDNYGADRVFVCLSLQGDEDSRAGAGLEALKNAGHPVIEIRVAEKADLGQEFFRWEFAVAAAGAALGVHPFNQPDVELAKELARKVMEKGSSSSARDSAKPVSASDTEALGKAIRKVLVSTKPGEYLGIHAYLAPTPKTTASLEKLQRALRDKSRLAITVGYGPRFLHSTGQLHKGGPNTGSFLQLVDEPGEPLPVPETDYTFDALIHAQALGDYQALVQRKRHVLVVNLGRDIANGMEHILEATRD